MAIPDFQTLMLPLLKFAGNGDVHLIKDARAQLATEFEVTAEEQAEMIPSGRAKTFSNRVAWAKTYLLQAHLLESPGRAAFRITDRGREVLNAPPDKITIPFLDQYPEFAEFRGRKKKSATPDKASPPTSPDTPEEQIANAYQQIRSELASELLGQVKTSTPEFFEHLVVELLVALGYGGSFQDAGKSVGKSGDEGIDGVIKEDRLGLDMIYLQAKRWTENTIGRPEIQKFVGALHGKRAKKGVFITTSSFSSEAMRYVETIDPKVVLIDGDALADLMIDAGLGVSIQRVYETKKIDLDFFEED